MPCIPNIIIYSDGGARGNPGPAGAGAVIIDAETKQAVATVSKYLGQATNNQAEYLALVYALEAAAKYQPQRLTCYLDSELIVRQLNGQYKVKNRDLKKHYLRVMELIGTTPTRFIHIPREKNQQADALANQAMDRGK